MKDMPISKNIRKELRALTSLRFFAAAMIVFLHCRGLFGIREQLVDSVALGYRNVFLFCSLRVYSCLRVPLSRQG